MSIASSSGLSGSQCDSLMSSNRVRDKESKKEVEMGNMKQTVIIINNNMRYLTDNIKPLRR